VTCYYPVKGFMGREGRWVSNIRLSPTKVPMEIPCKRCMGCRMDRAREWSVRIAHEASLHEASSFLTLTYSTENIPENGTLQVRDLQLFNKRLRKKLAPAKIRFFACGEYGGQTLRPHYHLILFGYDFPDKSVWRKSPTGHYLYRSKTLEELWTLGNAEIGTVTRESGQYVAKYCTKKIMGSAAASHYSVVDPETGEVRERKPEFAVMSTRPGIGFGWYKKYETDFNPSGFIVLDGVKYPVPRYYKEQIRGRNSAIPANDTWAGYDDLKPLRDKGRKARQTDQYKENHAPHRLAVREEVQMLKEQFYTKPGEEIS